MGGATHVDPKVAAKLFAYVARLTPAPRVTPTLPSISSEHEREILKLMTDGLNNADIAERLHILERHCVRSSVSNLFIKLDVTDRTQAALLAVRYGLVT